MCSVVKQNIHFSRNFEIFALAFACTYISCCSIFNDRSAAALAHSLGIIPHPPAFVKRFCKSFLKIFATVSKGRKCCLLYHIAFDLSIGFRKVFETFFADIRASRFRHTDEAIRRKLAYYSTEIQICQVFQRIFSLCKLNIFFAHSRLPIGRWYFSQKQRPPKKRAL